MTASDEPGSWDYEPYAALCVSCGIFHDFQSLTCWFCGANNGAGAA